MTYPYTKKILEEALEKRKIFDNYTAHLEKKIDSFCSRKLEKKRLRSLISKELMRTHKERSRLIIVGHRNRGVERFTSRNSEEDYAEMDKIKETLKPSEKKIEELQEKILDLNIDRDRKTLRLEANIAEGLLEDCVWKVIEAVYYEHAQKVEMGLLEDEFFKLDFRSSGVRFYRDNPHKLYKLPDLENGRDLKQWNSLSWKEVAKQQFEELQKQYFEDLERYLAKHNVLSDSPVESPVLRLWESLEKWYLEKQNEVEVKE
jgi:hypothetical protein